MNQTPTWKVVTILLSIVIGFIYALPNVYGEDPALQISATGPEPIGELGQARVKDILDKAGLTPRSMAIEGQTLLVRFTDTESQLKANDLVGQGLGSEYVVALNLAPATPRWLSLLGAKPMYLGLDLRGGVHFLLAVDTKAAMTQAEERFVSDLRAHFR